MIFVSHCLHTHYHTVDILNCILAHSLFMRLANDVDIIVLQVKQKCLVLYELKDDTSGTLMQPWVDVILSPQSTQISSEESMSASVFDIVFTGNYTLYS